MATPRTTGYFNPNTTKHLRDALAGALCVAIGQTLEIVPNRAVRQLNYNMLDCNRQLEYLNVNLC